MTVVLCGLIVGRPREEVLDPEWEPMRRARDIAPFHPEIGCWLLRHRLAEPSNVLEALMRLRKQDQERRQRMSPETAEQQRFVESWPEGDGQL